MNLSQLYYFQVVAKEQHISRAADKLRVSQPSLSTTIRRLEKELGVDLFDHGGRNIYLNNSGQRLLNHVDFIFNQIELLNQNLKKVEFDLSHKLVLAVNNSSLLDNWLSEFLANHTEAYITQMMMTETKILETILNEEVDIGLGDFGSIPEGIEHYTILQDEYVVLVPIDHPLAQQDKLFFDDIRDEPFVSLSSNITRRIVDHQFAQKKLTPNVVFEGHSRMMFKTLFQKRGLQFSSRQMTYMLTRPDLHDKIDKEYHQLRLMPIEDLKSKYNLSVCWKKNRDLPAMAEKLIMAFLNEYPHYTDDPDFCEKDTVLFGI